MEKIARVLSTAEANEVIDQLRQKHGCQLMFHQSGGCCDGSAPMCFEKGEFKIGSQDVWLGKVHGCDFFMTADQFEYWKHTHLTLDVVSIRTRCQFFVRNTDGCTFYYQVKVIVTSRGCFLKSMKLQFSNFIVYSIEKINYLLTFFFNIFRYIHVQCTTHYMLINPQVIQPKSACSQCG